MSSAGGPDVAFTCLIPVWGGDDAGCFATAIQSVAASTLAPNTILIAQDGLLPAPLAAAVRLATETLGCRLVVNPGPRGLQYNLNNAMRTVDTAYVARFDADDVNLPDRFAAQVAFARSNPDVAAFGGAILEFQPDGRTRRRTTPQTHESIVRFAAWRNPINHMTAFFRSDAFRAAGGYPDIPLKEDYGLWLAMLARGERLANMAEVLVRARLGEGFHRRRTGWKTLRSEWEIYRLKSRAPEIRASAAALAFMLRSAALAWPGPARLAYDRVLRR